jgi:hypothetical protein
MPKPKQGHVSRRQGHAGEVGRTPFLPMPVIELVSDRACASQRGVNRRLAQIANQMAQLPRWGKPECGDRRARQSGSSLCRNMRISSHPRCPSDPKPAVCEPKGDRRGARD